MQGTYITIVNNLATVDSGSGKAERTQFTLLTNRDASNKVPLCDSTNFIAEPRGCKTRGQAAVIDSFVEFAFIDY